MIVCVLALIVAVIALIEWHVVSLRADVNDLSRQVRVLVNEHNAAVERDHDAVAGS